MPSPAPRSLFTWLALGLAPAALLAGILIVWLRPGAPPAARAPGPVLATYEELSNSHFTPAPADPYRAPDLSPVALPFFPGAHAVWGATGRDSRGHVWFGVSAADVPAPSAHLYEYVPESRELFDRGDVITRLRECGAYRAGEGQMKIHSRIVQAQDGLLYFASLDEQGESEDGSRLPTWGSHLWRLRPADNRWEHLAAVPEGLVAVAGGGRYVYALGYFGHVLYQYDCQAGKLASVRVGSVGGHVSRNLLADDRGHAYVPRLRSGPGGAPDPVASLVEFDPSLRPVRETRLAHYIETAPEECHGIVAFQYLADRSIAFVTHPGYLYRVMPSEYAGGLVAPEGWMHPAGRAYVASLFTFDGKRFVMGASCRDSGGAREYEWVVHDLETQSARAFPLRVPVRGEGLLLYGSVTRDDRGDFYLVGADAARARSTPVVFRARAPGS
jgi:hypothetical protein